MSDTEWTTICAGRLYREVDSVRLEVELTNRHYSVRYYWFLSSPGSWRRGWSRTVSGAKRQCMRAMNRHRKESQP